jgi:hypothetical protein
LIREAAINAASGKVNARPFCVGKQVELQVHLYDNPYCQAVRELESERMLSGNILRLEGRSATAVWADYWQIKLSAQQRAEALK